MVDITMSDSESGCQDGVTTSHDGNMSSVEKMVFFLEQVGVTID